jgi:hypothetical protein
MTHFTLGAVLSFPVAMWALAFIALFLPNQYARILRIGLSAASKSEAISPARAWTFASFGAHVVVLIAVFFCLGRMQGFRVSSDSLRAFWSVVAGIVLGLATGGLLPLLRMLLPKERKFRILTLVALDRSLPFSSVSLAAMVLVEEIWRIACIRALIADGNSAETALLVTSVAFGIAFLPSGLTAGISESILGAVYGSFYLWSGSFLVSFAAHLTVQAEYVAIVWAASPTARPFDGFRELRRKCPACGQWVEIGQRKPIGVIKCAHCEAALSFQDSRTSFIRWGAVFVEILLWFAGFEAFKSFLGESERTLWIALVAAFPAFFSFVILMQIVFPPKLQCGLPGFIDLGLGRVLPSGSSDESNDDQGSLEINDHLDQ